MVSVTTLFPLPSALVSKSNTIVGGLLALTDKLSNAIPASANPVTVKDVTLVQFKSTETNPGAPPPVKDTTTAALEPPVGVNV